MKAIVVTHHDDFIAGGPGTVMWTVDNTALLNKCPGCGLPGTCPIKTETSKSPHWSIDQLDPITLSPSILHAGCGWHGFLRNGEFVLA